MHAFSAPSQTISYLSSHDDWTLWDKLVYSMHAGKRFAVKRSDVLRANKLAAAILFCCQGHVFMLSGEDFGRTKLGVKNSYRSSMRVNRLDWKRASRFRELTEYYRGLIALRKTLPGLCDKGAQAHRRITEVFSPMRGAAAIRLDNRGKKSRYSELMILINTAQEPCSLALPEGEWDILLDSGSSFLWKKPKSISGEAEASGVSALMLGRSA